MPRPLGGDLYYSFIEETRHHIFGFRFRGPEFVFEMMLQSVSVADRERLQGGKTKFLRLGFELENARPMGRWKPAVTHFLAHSFVVGDCRLL